MNPILTLQPRPPWNTPMMLLAVTTAAFPLALPAQAPAASLAFEGDTLVFRAAAGESNGVVVTRDGRDSTIAVGDSAVDVSFPADRCEQPIEDSWVECAVPARVRVELGDGNDRFSTSDVDGKLPIHVLGGHGADQLEATDDSLPTLDGGDGHDRLRSGDGPAVLLGAAGDDELDAGAGNDRLEGGDGNDVLEPDGYPDTPGDDYVDGGAGIDFVDDWKNPSGRAQPPVSITLDGQANDGRPGERDDVRGIEHIRSYVAGSFVLSDGPEKVDYWAPSDQPPATIDGRAGNDVIMALHGDQTIDGGAGDDRLEGGFGHDVLTGGPGRDVINGDFTGSQCGVLQSCNLPYGNDVINARDGEADTIDCGVGDDRAIVDALDVANGCEAVERGDIGSAGSKGAAQDDGAAGRGGSIIVTPRSLATALRTGLVVRVTGAARGRLEVRARRAGRTVGRGRGTVGASGSATVKVRFTRAARRSLRRQRSVRLTISAAGLRRTITLRR